MATVDNAFRAEKAVVLTTHERSSLYLPVLGDRADIRFDPCREPPLEDLLHNVIVAGGSLVVIDEAFFRSIDDMAVGLERFVRQNPHCERLKLIVVCSHRKPDDRLLAFLVMYCGIYNIIFDSTGACVSADLADLIRHDNARKDVIGLIEAGRWERMRDDLPSGACRSEALRQDACESAASLLTTKRIKHEIVVDVEDMRLVNLKLEFDAVSVLTRS